ncbi:agglutinin biogenesis protein MshP [Noviherbaspirillum sp.]|uniref:PulJ/GspJ family protein n=1 Tax=Noviherbaspirillum sp. TaxID=1926288 RepID=UPI002D4D589A|nr:agglutinin biogenesis protein MshP [Noviherbaspirillum sp.]HZW21681.1 agglutinin biogenesis protein MshP [Noviherbaspirillum sp.]
MKTMRNASKGFTLASAVFLLVIIAALGTFAVTLSTTQHQASAQDVLGVRALQAARGGIEWGVYQVLQNSGTGFDSTCRTGPATQALNLPGGLGAYTVNVTCTSVAALEAPDNIRVYTLTSTASQGTLATANYVERQLQVTIWRNE